MSEGKEQNAAPNLGQSPDRRRRTVILVGVLGLLVVLLAMLGFGLRPSTSLGLVGEPAPVFSLTAFNGDYAGQSIALDELRGQVVVLHVWASWCVECEPEMLLMERMWQTYASVGVQIIGVDYLDTDSAGLAYLERLGVTFPNGPDVGSQIFQDYHCTGVPETFFIDRQGVVRHVQIGVISEAAMRQLLDGLLSQEGA